MVFAIQCSLHKIVKQWVSETFRDAGVVKEAVTCKEGLLTWLSFLSLPMATPNHVETQRKGSAELVVTSSALRSGRFVTWFGLAIAERGSKARSRP